MSNIHLQGVGGMRGERRSEHLRDRSILAESDVLPIRCDAAGVLRGTRISDASRLAACRRDRPADDPAGDRQLEPSVRDCAGLKTRVGRSNRGGLTTPDNPETNAPARARIQTLEEVGGMAISAVDGETVALHSSHQEKSQHHLICSHQFGLASVLYTENYRQVMQAGNEIEAGELYINRTPADPYQGYHAGWKRSGLGGDDGKHGMLEFTQTRLVVMPY